MRTKLESLEESMSCSEFQKRRFCSPIERRGKGFAPTLGPAPVGTALLESLSHSGARCGGLEFVDMTQKQVRMKLECGQESTSYYELEKMPVSSRSRAGPVMLSRSGCWKEVCHAERSKHLLYLVENKEKQILRFAQNDVLQGFFAACWGR